MRYLMLAVVNAAGRVADDARVDCDFIFVSTFSLSKFDVWFVVRFRGLRR